MQLYRNVVMLREGHTRVRFLSLHSVSRIAYNAATYRKRSRLQYLTIKSSPWVGTAIAADYVRELYLTLEAVSTSMPHTFPCFRS